MSAASTRTATLVARFVDADGAGEHAAAIAMIEQHWAHLLFDRATSNRVFEVLGTTGAVALEGSPRAGLIAEAIGGLPAGSTRYRLPRGSAEIELAIRAGQARVLVEVAIIAMIAARVNGRPDTATEIAAVSRPLLQAASGTRFSPAADLVAYWHLQAAQASLHAGHLERARLDLEHAWASHQDDITGYVASSTAPFALLIATLTGDHEDLVRWQRAWAALAARTSTLIDAETMARPALIAELVLATDRLDHTAAARLAAMLEPQLAYDELWPLTLFALTRHLVDIGAQERARSLIASTLDRHPDRSAEVSLHSTFVPLARVELALADGRLHAVAPLLDLVGPTVFPGLADLYTARTHLAAGDATESRRHGRLAESAATQPRLVRASRYLSAFCEAAPRPPTLDALDPDLHRLASHLAAEGLPGDSVAQPLIALTPAERRTLAALAGPGTLTEVASRLHLSRNTLKTQTSSLFRKLDASSREELVGLARRHGLLED